MPRDHRVLPHHGGPVVVAGLCGLADAAGHDLHQDLGVRDQRRRDLRDPGVLASAFFIH